VVIGRFFSGVKRFILWDYPRASWQYDVMVGLILAFIFLTPAAWFSDQPRIPRASRIARLQAAHGTDVFWIEAELLDNVPEAQRKTRAADLLRERAGLKSVHVRLEPIRDSESTVTGYLAFTEP
jgi:acyl-coenzyme A synthetase/AMP-(fatty) acid ligase